MSTAEVRPKPEEHLVYSQNYDIRFQRLEEQQKVLSHLVLAVLCGLLVGFCVFCRLTTTTFKNTSEACAHSNSNETSSDIFPETKKTEMKPAALLRASYSQKEDVKKDEILLWTKEDDGFLIEMDYKDGFLTVKQEGIYFLYSKVVILESQCMARHTVKRVSPRYGDGSKPMDLMQSMRYLCPSSSQRDRQDLTDMSSSYLGGAFHLFAYDSIHVTLNAKMKPGHAENFFGAFML